MPDTPPVSDPLGRFRTQADQEGRLRRIQTGLSLFLVVEVVGFLLFNLNQAKANFQSEHFEAPLQEQVAVLTPILQKSAMRVTERVRPTVEAEAISTWQDIQPQLIKNVATEAEALVHTLETDGIELVRDSLEDIVDDEARRLVDTYPFFAADEDRAIFENELREMLADETFARLEVASEGFIAADGGAGELLEKFQTDRFAHLSHEDLMRHYVHLWLQVADYHVTGIHPTERDAEATEGGDS